MFRAESSLSFERRLLISQAIFMVAAVLCLYKLGSPAALFWDENYHLASAQKYLAGMFFMEPHPPLGKLLIALSEYAFGFNANIDVTPFLQQDHIKEVPKGFNFMPSRLPSTLMLAICVPLFFNVIYALTHRTWLALAFVFLFLTDTAFLLHGRAAHLDATYLCFTLWALLVFVHGFTRTEHRLRDYAWLALPIGLACATKANTGLLLLFPFVWWVREMWKKPLLQAARHAATKGGLTAAIVASLVMSAYAIHFALGKHIVFNQTYKASPAYQRVISEGQTNNPRYWPLMLRDSLRFSVDYTKGVPRLRPFMDGENGSHPLLWPFGIKSINYRWDKQPDGQTKYLQLAANPIGWGVGLLGLITVISLAVSRGLGESVQRSSARLQIAYVLLLAWALYLGASILVSRVLYLYHYFLPLIFTWCMAAAVLAYLLEIGRSRRYMRCVTACVALIVAMQAYAFYRYAPLAYHLPLSPEAFESLQLTSLWGMRVIK